MDFQKPTSTTNLTQIGTKVSDLIDFDNKCWRVAMIKQAFEKHDAEKICAMHLSSRFPPDRMIWRYTKNGDFTVKSAYHALKTQEEASNENRATSISINPLWKNIWRLRTLPKIKQFLWRACWGSLPTKEELVKKYMDVDIMCELCGEEPESLTHLLLRCRETTITWRTCPLRIDTTGFDFGSFNNFIGSMLSNLTQEAMELVGIISWGIWTARNKFYFEQQPFSATEIQKKSQRLFEETCRPTQRSNENVGPKTSHRWTPPPPGTLKLNSDAAIYKDGTVGYGFIIRHAVGDVILAGAKKTIADGSILIIEALAMMFALRSARETGIRDIHVESDCKMLIDGIGGK
ncbi:hypothetical protein DH2020_043139 [Rehmannia glutinosa]|uniref:Reverse transcriptase zinc-binding domain n=1 Tax=Rehmannia glutinosa TaxID=99300 RepID=A0ABR0UKI6_REHGL